MLHMNNTLFIVGAVNYIFALMKRIFLNPRGIIVVLLLYGYTCINMHIYIKMELKVASSAWRHDICLRIYIFIRRKENTRVTFLD